MTDSSGNGRDGTYGASGSSDYTGITGVAGLVAGNGAAQSVSNTLGHWAMGSTTMNGDFSIVLWAQESSSGGSTLSIPQLRIQTALSEDILVVNWNLGSSGNINIQRFYASGAGHLQSWHEDSSISPALDAPHMLALSYTHATPVMNLYVDGSFVGNTPGAGGYTSQSMTFTPTKGNFGVGEASGSIEDEFAFFTSALSGSDFSTLYSAAGSSFSSYNSSVLALSPYIYYHLDELTAASLGWHVGAIGMFG